MSSDASGDVHVAIAVKEVGICLHYAQAFFPCGVTVQSRLQFTWHLFKKWYFCFPKSCFLLSSELNFNHTPFSWLQSIDNSFDHPQCGRSDRMFCITFLFLFSEADCSCFLSRSVCNMSEYWVISTQSIELGQRRTWFLESASLEVWTGCLQLPDPPPPTTDFLPATPVKNLDYSTIAWLLSASCCSSDLEVDLTTF